MWVIHIPKHLSRRPVLTHKKAWQRIEDSLVELTQERMISLRESSKLTAYTKDGRYMKDNKPIENCVRPLADDSAVSVPHVALYRYHAITAIGTACIAASGTKISVLLFNLQR